MAVTLSQPADAMSDDEEMENFLEVEVTDAGAGPYVVIKTERWTISAREADQFALLVKTLIKKVEESNAIKNN